MKAAVQVLKKTEDLKQQVTGDFLNDNEAWNRHQKLQELYQQLLVIDLEYALDKKVEQDLWNYVFKNHINRLQVQTKDRKNPQRTECQENLVWFLETASGFYLQLLQELCETFDLDVPCRRKGSIYGISKEIKPRCTDITLPRKSSLLYICQHCLVHMGDIARYRNQSLQAETFYRHAAELVPSNGQPYNQLAILEAAKGDKLSTVFYYVRSIAVKYPFPVASTNLQKMFSKIANDEFQHEGKTKLSVYDYVNAFLQFHALVHLTSDLEKAHQLGKILATNLTILIATESLTAWKLIQMMAINLFAITHATRGLEAASMEQCHHESETLSEDEQVAYNLVLELIASTLNGLLLLVYTIKDDTELRTYYVLPVIKITLEWLRQDPSHLKAASFTSKFQIWPSFSKLLNGLQAAQSRLFDANKYVDVPLPEDWDLQSFLPLCKAYKLYKFRDCLPQFNHEEEINLRIERLVGLGCWLCEQEIYGVKLMTAQSTKEENKFTFEAITPQTPSSDVLKLLEEMTIGRSNCETSVTDSISSDSTSGVSLENVENSNSLHESGINGDVLALSGKSVGRQGKGQPGTLESCVEKTLMTKDGQNKAVITGGTGRERKTRQNVALQTIMQKKTLNTKNDGDDTIKPKSEGKMVTFKTPTPSPPASSGGTPPLAHLSALSPVQHCDGPVTFTPHHQTPYSVALQKSKGIVASSYGNGTIPTGIAGLEPNVALVSNASSNATRNLYSGLDSVFAINQPPPNKYGFYGNGENKTYSSHLHALPAGGGQAGVLRSPPVRDSLNAVGNVGNGNSRQPSARIGMTGVQGNIVTLPPHPGMLLNYNLNGISGNRQQQQPLLNPNGSLLQGPNARMTTVNQAAVAAAAAAAAMAAQKQQQSFAVNAAMFGPGAQAPPPQPPPWFHQASQTTQGQLNLTQPPTGRKPPNIEQFLSHMQGTPGNACPPHLPPPQSVTLHQAGQMTFANVMPNQPFATVPRPQHFPQPTTTGEATHFMYQMMGPMNEAMPFSSYPPNIGIVNHSTSVSPQTSGSGNMSQESTPELSQLCHGLHHSHPSVTIENSASSVVLADAQHLRGRQHGSMMVSYEDQTMKNINFQHLNSPKRQDGVQGLDSSQQPGFEENAFVESNMPLSNENMPSTYSLFNSPWSSGLNLANNSNMMDKREYTPAVNTADDGDELGKFLQPKLQSLWSGPGPSPLERLLEQQKLKKDATPH